MPEPQTKTIVLTGATRGLGRAMTAGFIAAGHTVIGCGRSPESVQQLAEEYGSPHRFYALDVSDDAAVAAWAASVLANYPPPDLLVNNAGLINANAPLWEVPAEEFSRVIDVNLKGPANTIRHFVPTMIERGSGVIVNFSSGWGRSTAPEVGPYCTTKWGIEGLSRALAQALPSGLAAVPLNPGIIDTEMLRSCFGGSASSFPDPDTWARTAVPFLLELGPGDNGEPLTVPV